MPMQTLLSRRPCAHSTGPTSMKPALLSTNPRPHSPSKWYSYLSQSYHTVHIYHLANPLCWCFCISHFPVAFKENTDILSSLNYLLPNHSYITFPLLKCTELPYNTVFPFYFYLSTNLKRIFSHCLNGCGHLIYNYFLSTSPDIIFSAFSMSNNITIMLNFFVNFISSEYILQSTARFLRSTIRMMLSQSFLFFLRSWVATTTWGTADMVVVLWVLTRHPGEPSLVPHTRSGQQGYFWEQSMGLKNLGGILEDGISSGSSR